MNLSKNKELLNNLLNEKPYADFWSAKAGIIDYLKKNNSTDFEKIIENDSFIYLIETLALAIDSLAFTIDSMSFAKIKEV